MRSTLTLIALMLMLSASAFAQVAAVPNTMQFQARLSRPDGTAVPDGTYSVRFSLHTALTAGTEKWNQTLNVTTKTGNFAVLLSGFPAGTFNGDLFLEMKIGTDAPLTPRQPLASVAYAMKADKVKDGSITSASIANGTITAADLAPNLLNPLAWLLGGNASPAPDSFLGTLTNFPLELRTNNRRAMEYRYFENTATAGQEYRSINVLGGSSVNEIEFGVIGATIAGGGKDFFSASLGDGPNRVTAEFGSIGGGYNNLASGPSAVVGGGEGNSATSSQSTVAGGQSNTASGQLSSVLGGYGNVASGLAATVAGGFRNSALATTSFAAGNNAKAIHTGSFVWADSQGGDFASTGPNQFMVRAAGGIALMDGWVGIGTNAPQGALHIKGFQGALNLEGITQHVYIQFFPRGLAAGRKAYIGFPAGAAMTSTSPTKTGEPFGSSDPSSTPPMDAGRPTSLR